MLPTAAILLNFRNAALTAKCVASLISQVGEIVVVENSDDDAEAHRISDLLSRRHYHRAIRLAQAPVNLGFARGVAFGIANITNACASVLVINNDATAGPHMVERMQAELAAHGGRAIVAAQSVSTTPSRLWYHRSLGLVLRRPFPGAFTYLGGACLLIPTDIARDGPFDPEFFMYGEDVEFSWRMSRLGVPLVVSDGQFEHVGNASSGSGSLFYEYGVARGHLLLASKLARGHTDRAALYLCRCLSLSARAAIRSLRVRNGTPLRALTLAFRRVADPAKLAGK